jgi:hypothetical protein
VTTKSSGGPEALYISGPMTGIPEHNFPLFNQVTEYLRGEGFLVYNPAEHFDGKVDLPREQYMREDFACLLHMCNHELRGIVLLPGWENSKGARAEVVMARELGFKFYDWRDGALKPWPYPDDGTDIPIAPLKFIPATGEVRITDPKTGGQKGQKPAQMSYFPFDALTEISKVYQYGASKYARDNWKKGYNWSLNFDAMMRHMFAFWEGEDIDPESHCSHVAHAAWHAITLLWFQQHYKEGDDRAKSRNVPPRA